MVGAEGFCEEVASGGWGVEDDATLATCVLSVSGGTRTLNGVI